MEQSKYTQHLSPTASRTAEFEAARSAERVALVDLAWIRSTRDQALDELLQLGLTDTSERAESLRRRVAVLDDLAAERSANWAEAHAARLRLTRDGAPP